MNLRELSLLLQMTCFVCSLLSQEMPTAIIDQARFELIDTRDGLPENSIQAICEDHLGLIWLGTQNGLVKYDGYQMKTYHYQPDDASFPKQTYPLNVWAIAEDPSGDLWIGTDALQPFGENYRGRKRENPLGPLVYRFDRQSEKLIPYLYRPEDSTQIINQTIRAIYAADEHDIWLGTSGDGMYRIQPETEYFNWRKGAEVSYRHYSFDNGLLSNQYADRIRAIAGDPEQATFWVATVGGLLEWDENADTFRTHLPQSGFPEWGDVFTSIAPSASGKFWLGCAEFIASFDPASAKFEYHFLPALTGSFNPYAICEDQSGKLWIGFFAIQGQLIQWDQKTRKSKQVRFQLDIGENAFYPHRKIRTIMEDRAGNLWVGTHRNGLYKFNAQHNEFHWLESTAAGDKLKNITAVTEDRDSNLWIATHGDGLFRWDRKKNDWEQFTQSSGRTGGLADDRVLNVAVDPTGLVWYGSMEGAGYLDTEYDKFEKMEGLTHPRGVAVYPGRKNDIWFTEYDGFDHLNRSNGTIKHYLRGPMQGVLEDSDGIFWIGTTEVRGFYRFDPESETEQWFDFSTANVFLEDSEGFLWIGTHSDGLLKMDRNTLEIKPYQMAQGLPHNSVKGILQDDRKRLWISTNKGLARFDPATETFRNFTVSDGLPTNTFSHGAYRSRSGEFYFPTVNGVLYFHPDRIQANEIEPKLVFTGLDLFNKPVPIDHSGILNQHISLTRQIELSYLQNDLNFHFAALHYKNAKNNTYQVFLENFDRSWRPIGNQTFANYTNLDPGQYTFRVKAANSDGIWNEEGIALDIIIHPPWFWNGGSKALYLLLLTGGIIVFYRYQLHRSLALAEAHRLRELDEVKTRLYTNVTHEFRTPLTVIQGTTEQIRDHETEKDIIQRNSRNLLALVNRMLDWAKFEAGQLRPHLIQGNILPYLSYITESFHSLAINEKINLNFYTDQEELVMDYDPEKILQILSNLISNALKFTREYGKVSITARQRVRGKGSELVLEVKDTGIGIAPEELPFIFRRFERGESAENRRVGGTGIGLALTRELVDLMNGEIRVESNPGQGSIFTVVLPVTNKAAPEPDYPVGPASKLGSYPDDHGTAVVIPAILTEETGIDEPPRLLIVEDNLDVLQFIASCLQRDYELLFARNGREGIDSALGHIPDIIISDVMMPEVDGFELCSTLKRDERTSHIPIILLTAKADTASKLEGLEYGADAYLVKPFHRTELEIRLRKLIELRRQLQERYSRPDFRVELATEKEDTFVLKVREQVRKHLQEDPFGPEQLSKLLLMHRSQLHRKLKALTGKSTSIFIREIRLQRADQLLRENDLSVKEVAYEVGFSDPGYFSKLFIEMYGRPPSEV